MDEQGGAGLSSRMIVLVADARAQWAELDRRISAFEAEFVRWVKENEEARRLTTIPGVGPIGKLRPWTRSRRVARPGSPSVHHWRQAEAARNQQTRQQVSAQTVDPWSARRAALYSGARHAAWPVGERADEQDPSQCRGRRLGQQAGEDRCSAGNRLTPGRYPWPPRIRSVGAKAPVVQARFARG